jgi:3,4-dihydroxy-2-butanone 4-phosphate synthase/GTP cyclohydrolase II
MKHDSESRILRRLAITKLPTKWGEFQAIGFQQEICNGIRRFETAVALVLGSVTADAPLLRIHSQCLTGDVLGSLRCDCGEQLELAMRAIAREGCGLLIYEQQEGRGIGLMAKLQAYELQDAGLDTVEANHALGFETDRRDFSLPTAILHKLGIRKVRLLSNNPNKSRALIEGGIDVVEEIACEVPPNPHSLVYLRAMKEKMGHALSLTDRRDSDFLKDSRADGPGRRGESKGAVANKQSVFASVEDAICELRTGRMIVVVDDEDRENEGDLVMAAEMITPEAINFMAAHGRGLICLAMTGERLDELQLAPMALDNSALGGTGFTVSIDAKGHGMTTGISASDRAQTIRAAIDARSRPEDFARPGHVFPLRSRARGVLERRGHTEAAVDIACLAGLHASGVICEILNADGTMARVPDLVQFCKIHELKMITIADLEQYRLKDNNIVRSDGALVPEFAFRTSAGNDARDWL